MFEQVVYTNRIRIVFPAAGGTQVIRFVLSRIIIVFRSGAQLSFAPTTNLKFLGPKNSIVKINFKNQYYPQPPKPDPH
jgi:hypothetical protein